MRRLGIVISVVLLMGGLSLPAYAGTHRHVLTSHGGRIFFNHGPRHADSVAVARTTVNGPVSEANPDGTIDVSDDTQKVCTTGLPTTICVWYSPDTLDPNAPAGATYVNDVAAALQTTETTYLNAGYRAVEPSADAEPGYGGTMNVYLHDLGGGPDHLYGFTATDYGGPQESSAGRDSPAYMVIDNDFKAAQYSDANGFPGCSSSTMDCSVAIMQATIAHEFFHATQFAYDAWYADPWFMEATATWAETQVYPSLHDNWLYFDVPDGVLTKPWLSLDDNTGSASGLAYYQNFSWIQYLGRRFPARYGSGTMPQIILNAWRLSSARQGRPTSFSVTALARAITSSSAGKVTLAQAWLAFSAGNRHHGLGPSYPTSQAYWSHTVSPTNLAQAKVKGALRHLSSQTYVLTPRSLASTEHIHLAVRVATQNGTAAGVTMYYRNGAIRTYPLTFTKGYATRNFGFDSASLLRVELTLSSAGTSYANCWTERTNWACDGGTPSIDNVGFTWSGSFYHL